MNPRNLKRKPGKNGNYQRNLDHKAATQDEKRMIEMVKITQSCSGFFNHSDEKGEGTLSKEEKKLQSTDSKKDCHPAQASSARTSDVINTKKYDLASPRKTNGIALFDARVSPTESEEKILEKKIKHLFADIEEQLLATIGDFAIYPSGNTWTKYRIRPFNGEGYNPIPMFHFKNDEENNLPEEAKANMKEVIKSVNECNMHIQEFNKKFNPNKTCHP